MNRQEILDTVITHARTQNKRAVDYLDWCQYRTEENLKCFIGCLIPDALYNPNMEEKFITSKELVPVQEYLQVNGEEDEIFLNDLQKIHDNKDPHEWEDEFERFAQKYNLIIKEK